MSIPFPFSAIVGQDEMKLALMLAAVDPTLGGVLVLGDRGTGKSTAVRALADILPPISVVENCRYGCDPAARNALCNECREAWAKGPLKRARRAVRVVDLPLGATEDRVAGALDLERALVAGEARFQPGLLAKPIAASSTSTRSTCSRTTSSTCCSMSRPRARTSSSASR